MHNHLQFGLPTHLLATAAARVQHDIQLCSLLPFIGLPLLCISAGVHKFTHMQKSDT